LTILQDGVPLASSRGDSCDAIPDEVILEADDIVNDVWKGAGFVAAMPEEVSVETDASSLIVDDVWTGAGFNWEVDAPQDTDIFEEVVISLI